MATMTLARGRAKGTGTVDAALRRLTAFEAGTHRVVSCYLKLEPRDRVRGKYLIKLKNRVRDLEAVLPRLGLERTVQEEVSRDLARILAYLGSPGNLPSANGIALFACGPRKLFEAVPLPSVHRSRLAVDRTPLVRELVAVQEEFGRLYTVVMDRTSARIFAVTADAAREVSSLVSASTRGGRYRGDQDGPGWGEHSYNNRIREERQRHADSVARELYTLDRREAAHGIVLAGPGADAGVLAPFLHPDLRGRLFGTVKLNPKELSPAAVHAATLEVRAAAKREEERALVAEVRSKVGERWAVNGIAETLRALARGQVRTLLVDADAAEPGYRCSATGRLVLDPADARGEGEALPVVDVVDEAIEDALRQHVPINVVFEPEAAKKLRGLAGLLRFR